MICVFMCLVWVYVIIQKMHLDVNNTVKFDISEFLGNVGFTMPL